MAATLASVAADLAALTTRFDLLCRDFYHHDARKASAKELSDIVAGYGVQLPRVNRETGVMSAADVAAFIDAIAAKPTHKNDRNAAVCERAAHLLRVCGWSVP